jgi:hypothetical protein
MKTKPKQEGAIDNFAKKYIDVLEKLAADVEKDQKDSLTMNLTPIQIAARIRSLDEIKVTLVRIGEEFNEGNYDVDFD